MAIITLTKGYSCEVDDEDYIPLSKYRWWVNISRKGKLYVQGSVDGQKVYMHRFLTNATKEQEVDHEDGNGLNNRRKNLRKCTHSQNMANSKRDREFIGISKNHNNFAARVGREYLGTYKTAKEAAVVRDKRAVEIYGDYARLNFPK